MYDLSFDPRDPEYEIPKLPEVRWGIQVFTTHNFYGLNPARTRLTQNESGLHLVCDELSWAGQQKHFPGRVEVHLTNEKGSWCWQIQAEHNEPIKAIKLLLWGLPEAALAQGWWSPTHDRTQVTHPTTKVPLRWNYPWPEWLTAWACAGEGEDESGAVCVSVRDTIIRAKRLYVHLPPYNDSKPVVEIVTEQDARNWSQTMTAPQIRLRLCEDKADIDSDFTEHLAFLEQTYRLPVWEERRDLPEWVRKIRLVLNLHGQHWTGYVFNDFEKMAATLRFVTQFIPGEHVLAYIPGWEGRYYYVYPNYQPGPDLGGEEGFRNLLRVARELGVHVMPMFGMHGANVRQYPEWEKAAFRSTSNRYVKVVNRPDWDGDRVGEDDQIFLNPGEPDYRKHLTEQVSRIVDEYGVEGVFLDTSACWFNDPRYNLYEGYRLLLAELHRRHPNLLIAGEGWWDALLALFPVNQSWLGVERNYRYPQLLTRYARALGHLAEGTPGRGSTGVHELGFRPEPFPSHTPGHIPALGFVDDTLECCSNEIAAICNKLNLAELNPVVREL